MPKQRKPRQSKVSQRAMPSGNAVYAIDRGAVMEHHRQRQMLNELELLQRLPVPHELQGGNYHPQMIQMIQAQMVPHQPPPQPVQPQPVRQQPEPSYKGMSREAFHAHVRQRLEDVAQAALNRTDGERDYQHKEQLIKQRLRAAVKQKQQPPVQPPQGCSVGASPTTPQASIFHTPSPSPTFRTYQPVKEPVPAQYGYHHLVPQLNNNPVKFSNQPHPYLIATASNGHQYHPNGGVNPVHILGPMKNQIILINNAQPFHQAPNNQPHHHHHHHHLAQNVQNVFTN